jgi:hypothetical protein
MMFLHESIKLEKNIMALLKDDKIYGYSRGEEGEGPNLGCGLAPCHESFSCSLNSSSRFGEPHIRYITKHFIGSRGGPSASCT